MSKVTLATLKSFLKNNEGKIYFQEHSAFDGMVDCVMPSDKHSWVYLYDAKFGFMT